MSKVIRNEVVQDIAGGILAGRTGRDTVVTDRACIVSDVRPRLTQPATAGTINQRRIEMKIWLVNKGMNWEGHTTVAVCLRQSSALKVLKSFKGFEEPREVGAGGAVCAQGTEFGSEYIEIVPMELKL